MQALLIFSGYNERALIAFFRTLEKNAIPFAVIAKNSDDFIFKTHYAKNVYAIRQASNIDKKDIRRAIAEVKNHIGNAKLIIAPSTESLNRFFLTHQEFFAAENCHIPLVSFALYQKISDKKSFADLCAQFNIATPKELLCLKENIPFVAKPVQYDWQKPLAPILITSLEEFHFFEKNEHKEDYYFQEFIYGDSYYLLYYVGKDKILKFSQQNLMQQAEGKSIIAAIPAQIHRHQSLLKYEEMLQAIGFVGLIMIEVRYAKEAFYMIEANPRFWGPSQLFIDSGINLFNPFLEDLGFLIKKVENNPTKLTKTARYFWSAGISETLHVKKRVAFHSYSEEQFFLEKNKWLAHDVFNREDSKDYFKLSNLG